MKTKIKEKKLEKNTADKKHSFATKIFLAQLIIAPVITVFGTFASFAVFTCNDPSCSSSTNNSATGGLWFLATILALAALFAWLKNHRLLSIRLSKVLIAIPSIAGLINGGAILLGLSQYVDPAEATINVLLSALPIALLVFVTIKQRYILKEASSVTASLIAKTLFITQLLIFIIISGDSIFNGCANAECTQYDLPNFLFTLVLTICSASAFIAWLIKKRALSVRLSQVSLTLTVLGIIWILASSIWQYVLMSAAERAPFLEFFTIPSYLVMTLFILAIPFACLYLVTHYKKQIIEN